MKSLPHKPNLITLVYERGPLDSLPTIQDSDDAAEHLRTCYPNGTMDLKEIFFAMYLSHGNQVLAISKLSEGGMTATILDIRHLFVRALLLNASAVILCHNHPSGTMVSSQKDVEVSLKCVEAGKLLDVQVLDHIILTSEGYVSLADDGLLSNH